MLKAKPIYVEIVIHTDMETLWKHTQTPELHQQWDLRFSEITYLPKMEETDSQRFLYKTRIGFGLSISGEGETVGTQEKNGEKTSFLKFGSDHPISLIHEGAGFWKYIPADNGIRFLTRYDYRPRFGIMGRFIDRMLFRPLMGWATAWSFDALRLWLEKGTIPMLSILRTLSDRVCLLILGFNWVYQGMFPKLLYPQSGELAILKATALFPGRESLVLSLVGVGEIVFGALFYLLGQKKRKFLYLFNLLLLVVLGLGALSQPWVFVEPFNPVTLNLSMMALSVVGLLSLKDLPNASNGLRKPHS